MSDGVIPVLRQVVLTAMHMRSAGRCPVRWWKRPTRVIVLRGSSWSLALRVSAVVGSQEDEEELGWYGCAWRIGWAARRSVRRLSMWSGTRHSREAGFRGIRRVYALPMSVTMVSKLVNVTLWPAATMSWTQTRAVLNLSGTIDVW